MRAKQEEKPDDARWRVRVEEGERAEQLARVREDSEVRRTISERVGVSRPRESERKETMRTRVRELPIRLGES